MGRTREDAQARLDGAGLELSVVRTSPPWPGRPAGAERVVRQRWSGRRVELVVAAEEHRRERP